MNQVLVNTSVNSIYHSAKEPWKFDYIEEIKHRFDL